MIIWGGYNGSSGVNTGGRYTPAFDIWAPTSTGTAPTQRYAHSAVWSGTEMIVWGGYSGSGGLNIGGRFNPATSTWTPVSLTGAPSVRYYHSAVWTGSQMIVWGGFDGTAYPGTSSRYQPSNDTWISMSASGAPAGRAFPRSVWTGSEMIVWGGGDSGYNVGNNTGGRYNPGADTWATMTLSGAPSGRACLDRHGNDCFWRCGQSHNCAWRHLFLHPGSDHASLPTPLGNPNSQPVPRIAVALFLTTVAVCVAGSAPSLVDDRAAIELVYYNHRTGTKPPFEQTLRTAQIEKLVTLDLKKEAALKRVYGVEITDSMIEAEVRRINETTRAPEVLAELKAALGNDSARFARSMARPIVVERTLRARFENDDQLHASERGKVEALRASLLKGGSSAYADRVAVMKVAKLGDAPEVTFQLTPRPAGDKPAASPSAPSVPTEVKARSSAYSIEATAQVAQVLASPEKPTIERDQTHYFEDLPPELQNVLRAQLQNAGDVSAVIETAQGFLLYLAKDRTANTLSVSVLSLPKRSYEEWLASMQN